MIKVFLILIVVVMAPYAASAEGLIDLLECKNISNDASRLTCYDMWADKVLEVPEQKESKAPVSTSSSWSRYAEESKMDGTTNLHFSTPSLGTLSNSIGTQKSATLVLRCNQRKTEAFIIWPCYIGSRDGKQVEAKLDDGKIEKKIWSPSSDGTAVFRPKPVDWIKSMSGGKKLFVRLAAYQHIPEEVEFDITGIDTVADEIAKICRWSAEAKK